MENKKTRETKLRINIYLSPEVWEILKEQAKIANLSRSALVQKLIQDYKRHKSDVTNKLNRLALVEELGSLFEDIKGLFDNNKGHKTDVKEIKRIVKEVVIDVLNNS